MFPGRKSEASGINTNPLTPEKEGEPPFAVVKSSKKHIPAGVAKARQESDAFRQYKENTRDILAQSVGLPTRTSFTS